MTTNDISAIVEQLASIADALHNRAVVGEPKSDVSAYDLIPPVVLPPGSHIWLADEDRIGATVVLVREAKAGVDALTESGHWLRIDADVNLVIGPPSDAELAAAVDKVLQAEAAEAKELMLDILAFLAPEWKTQSELLKVAGLNGRKRQAGIKALGMLVNEGKAHRKELLGDRTQRHLYRARVPIQ